MDNKESKLKSFWRKFQKNKLAVAGLIVFVLMTILALTASLYVDYEEDVLTQNVHNKYASPSSEHIFGTDQLGRDMFGRIVYGARISMFVGLTTILMSASVGLVIGAISGYYGGKVDIFIMRIMDVFMAIPSTLLAIAIVAALGTDLFNLLLAMSISQTPQFARIVRSAVMSVRGQEYVEAANACGIPTRKIILKYVLPNAMAPIIVQATLTVARTILTISSLSFVGLGVQPPTPEWGSMLADGKSQMRYYPHLVIIPGLAIVITVMSLNLIGDGLRDAFDPRLNN